MLMPYAIFMSPLIVLVLYLICRKQNKVLNTKWNYGINPVTNSCWRLKYNYKYGCVIYVDQKNEGTLLYAPRKLDRIMYLKRIEE